MSESREEKKEKKKGRAAILYPEVNISDVISKAGVSGQSMKNVVIKLFFFSSALCW